MRIALVIALTAALGCSDGDEAPASPPADAAADAAPDDTGGPHDTVAPDLTPADEGAPDTAPPDGTPPPQDEGGDTGSPLEPGDPIAIAATVALSTPPSSPAALAFHNDAIAVCDDAQVALVDPSDLTPAGAPIALPGRCLSVASDGLAIAASSDDGQWTLAAADAAPVSATAPAALGLRLTGTQVLGALNRDGIGIAPRDDLAAVQVFTAAQEARDVMPLGADRLVVADGTAGLALLETGTMTEVARMQNLGIVTRLAPMDGTRIAAALGSLGVGVFELAGDTVELIGQWPTLGMANDVVVGPGGTQLIVADWDALRVVDATDVTDLRVVARQSFQPAHDSGAATGWALAVEPAQGGYVVAGLDHLTRLTVDATKAAAEVYAPRGVIQIEVLAGEPKGASGVIIKNTGRADLEVRNLTATSDRISIESLVDSGVEGVDILVPAGDSGFFEVVVTGTEPLDASVTMETNDPDLPTFTVPVQVNPPLLQVGDPAPDIMVPDVYGGMVRLSELAGQVVHLKLFSAL